MIKKLLAVSGWWLVVGAMALTAWADTQTWSGTKNFTANATITEAITVSGEVTVSVASGKTVTLKGAITGTDKITKTGLGTLLILSANDDFSGGFVIEKGYLTASNATALGRAAVTIVGQTANNSGNCCLGLWGTGMGNTTGITYTNAINITGNTTYACPALIVYGQNAKLTGKITAAKDFTFYDDLDSTKAISSGFSDRAAKVTSCTFGEIEAGGLIQHDGWTRFNFAKKVKASAFVATWNRSETFNPDKASNRKAKYEFKAALDVKAITNSTRDVLIAADGVFNGLMYVMPRDSRYSSKGIVFMQGHDLKLAGLNVQTYTLISTDDFSFYNATSYGYKTLTIDGGIAIGDTTAKTVTSSELLRDRIHLTIDAFNGFTQVISNRVHTMTGTITVKNGTFRVSGATTFANVPTLDVQGGALEINSTTDNCFPAVDTVSVANGGLLKLTSTTLMPFSDRIVNLELGATGKVYIPEGVTWLLNSLTINGIRKSAGQYTKAELANNIEGGGTIDTFGEVTENTWTGGAGDDKKINTAGNWQSAVPSFTDGTLDATFASDGEEAVVNTLVWLSAITFDTPAGKGGFTFSKQDEGELKLSSNIEFADNQTANQNAHVYTLGAPMTLLSEQVWNVPTNDTLKVTGGLTSEYGISLDGKGKLEFSGTNTIDGRLEFSNFERLTLSGKLTASDPESQGEPSTLINGHSLYISRKWFYQNKGTVSDIPVVLDNVYVDKPTYLEPIVNYYRRLIYCKPATTNIFARAVTTQQAQFEVTVAEGAELNLAGGVTSGWSFYKYGSGLMRISGGSWNQTESLLCNYEGPMRVESTGNKFNLLTVDGATAYLDFAVDNAITSVARCELTKGTMNISVGTQRVPFVLSTANATLAGSAGTVLFFTNGGVPVGATKYGTTNLCCKITGAVGVTQGGAQKLVINTKAESTGPLAVTKGVLELAANASWKNGTNFTANGTGTLKLSAANQVNSDFAVLHIADTGKVEIPVDVTNVVCRAETNGVWLAPGNYTCTGDGGADGATKISQLTGKGVLSVRGDDKVTTYDASASGEPNVKTVIVSNSWAEANIPEGKTITDTPTGGNGYPYWKSYVLGLTPTDPVSKPIIKGVQNADPNKLAFRLGNVTYNAASGVKATYRVRASNTVNGSSWTDVSESVDADKDAEVPLPTDSPVKYYKVFINYSN